MTLRCEDIPLEALGHERKTTVLPTDGIGEVARRQIVFYTCELRWEANMSAIVAQSRTFSSNVIPA